MRIGALVTDISLMNTSHKPQKAAKQTLEEA
jgi:hypothetical protein